MNGTRALLRCGVLWCGALNTQSNMNKDSVVAAVAAVAAMEWNNKDKKELVHSFRRILNLTNRAIVIIFDTMKQSIR